MSNRSNAEGFLIWVLIIATPIVLLWGSKTARSMLARYWEGVLIYVGICGALWIVWFLVEPFSGEHHTPPRK
jgi:hypothetical protein